MDVVLVDAKNATYRHGWTRSSLHNSAGQPTGAIFGILSCLLRLYKFHPKAQFIFCWDGKDTYKSCGIRYVALTRLIEASQVAKMYL